MKKNFLINTKISKTWPKNKKNYLIFSNIHAVENYYGKQKKYAGYRVTNSRWENKKVMQKDYVYLKKLYENILSSLSKTLNNYHQKNYSSRFWRIFLGPWLITFITIYFHKWHLIRKTFKKQRIDAVKFLKYSDGDIAPYDLEDFKYYFTSDDVWKQKIYQKIILNFISPKKIKYLKNVKSLGIKKPFIESNFWNFKNIFLYFFSFLKLNRFYKFLICSTYLGLKNELNLSLRFKQLPIIYRLISVNKKEKYSFSERALLKKDFFSNKKFEKELMKTILEEIPISYIEGFKNLKNEIKKLNYPSNPKVIFSSNFLWYDTLSAFYTAQAVEIGAKLIYGQHGGAYGLSKISWMEDHEIKIANKYLTWGWKNKKHKRKIINQGILLNTKKFKRSKNANKITIIFASRKLHTHSFETGLGTENYLNYINFCSKYVNLLPKDFDENIVLRFPPDSKGEIKSNDFYNTLSNKYNCYNACSFSKACESSKLVVNTVNSTPYLELLSANFPTITIWDPKANPIRKDAKKYIKLLFDAKILHHNPISAAKFTKKIWENGVDKWWYSRKVQKAVKIFCNNYAKSNDNLVDQLCKNINYLSNQ